MLFCLTSPPVDPHTRKALRLPIVNPIDPHGRVFFLSWFSFMLSFLAWYALPPLLTRTIKDDLNLTDNEIANSNIVALVAGLLTRLLAGPLCDKYGPRYVLVGILWSAALPTAIAGVITNAVGLYFIRFFIGIAGAAFVPCQVWTAAWYDKSVVGTSTAFAGGWGDAGVGVTFFVMPSLFESFMNNHNHDARIAWRLAFIVPAILLISAGIACLLLSHDVPTGRWATRHESIRPSTVSAIVDQPSYNSTCNSSRTFVGAVAGDTSAIKDGAKSNNKVHGDDANQGSLSGFFGVSVVPTGGTLPSTRRGSLMEQGLLRAPTSSSTPVQPSDFFSGLPDLWSLTTLLLAIPYAVSFGGSLMINSGQVAFYLTHFTKWDQTKASQWAAMFGLLNFVTRPCGGLLADVIYGQAGAGERGLHSKKYWISLLISIQGVFCLWVGLLNPDGATLIGGIAGIAIFMQAANGAIYALVPQVNPHINGLMGGTVGAIGNLGGIIFSVIARYQSFDETLWILGICSLIAAIAIIPINPIRKRDRSPKVCPTVKEKPNLAPARMLPNVKSSNLRKGVPP